MTAPPPAADPAARLRDGTAWTAAYDYWHDRYQQYYLTGLREAVGGPARVVERPLQRFPGLLRAARRVRWSDKVGRVVGAGGWRLFDRAAAAAAGDRLPPAGVFHPLVGQYELTFEGGRTVRLAVDASDGGEVASEPVRRWSQVYAKTNYRPDLGYPDRVVPAVNGNPTVLPHRPLLRQLRAAPKRYDVCLVVRVWGGRNEADGVEHNLRLLEAVNKARCAKFLLAYLVAGDIGRQAARLHAQGIPTTTAMTPLRRLWEVSAAARLNVIRLGMHNCVPWRAIDLLAMGAAVVFDQPPQTVWPAPLIDGTHYRHLGLGTTPDQPLAADARYDEVPGRVEELVRDAAAADRLAAAANYFDRHADPAAVGRHLIAAAAAAGGAG